MDNLSLLPLQPTTSPEHAPSAYSAKKLKKTQPSTEHRSYHFYPTNCYHENITANVPRLWKKNPKFCSYLSVFHCSWNNWRRSQLEERQVSLIALGLNSLPNSFTTEKFYNSRGINCSIHCISLFSNHISLTQSLYKYKYLTIYFCFYLNSKTYPFKIAAVCL